MDTDGWRREPVENSGPAGSAARKEALRGSSGGVRLCARQLATNAGADSGKGCSTVRSGSVTPTNASATMAGALGQRATEYSLSRRGEPEMARHRSIQSLLHVQAGMALPADLSELAIIQRRDR